MSEITIQQGDNIELLKIYPNNYFDSVVTDCPYGLGKEPDALKLLQDWIDHGYHEIKGKGFMGNTWDAFVPQPLFWKEIFRVLKPGGYVLAFFGTRTYDWGTMAIRLAGFEIRDMITWHYGSGFPKSLDISKGIDKVAGAEREVIGSKGLNVFKGTRGDKNKGRLGIDNRTFEQADALTAPSTDDAKQWQGYGTALKPATEPICVAHKPIEGTVVQNIIKYGTGGINIDGCRIDFESENDLKSATFGTGTNIIGGNYVGSKLTDGRKNIEANPTGRFPANVILDPYMGARLDDQTGILKSGSIKSTHKQSIDKNGHKLNSIYGKYGVIENINIEANEGGASRFFYCAKSSQDERNAGCEHLIKQKGGFKNDSGRGMGSEYNEILVENFHPTVKPISLMRYLQRLVTPKGGKTLDPYAGSGTSGCAAAFEEISIVLMEMMPEYIPIIEARTAYWQKMANREKYIQQLKDSQTKLF